MSSRSGSRLFPASLLKIIQISQCTILWRARKTNILSYSIFFLYFLWKWNLLSVFPLCLFNFGDCFQSCSILRVFAKYIMKIIRVCALWWSGELSPLKRANCFHWDEILNLGLIFADFWKPSNNRLEQTKLRIQKRVLFTCSGSLGLLTIWSLLLDSFFYFEERDLVDLWGSFPRKVSIQFGILCG